MSAEWTPTTEQVREGYAYDAEEEYRNPDGYPTAQRENRQAFNRWLVQHDNEQAKKILVAFAAGGYGFNEMFQADGKWVIEIKGGLINSVEEFVGDFTDGFHAAQYFEHVADAIAARRGEDV